MKPIDIQPSKDPSLPNRRDILRSLTSGAIVGLVAPLLTGCFDKQLIQSEQARATLSPELLKKIDTVQAAYRSSSHDGELVSFVAHAHETATQILSGKAFDVIHSMTKGKEVELMNFVPRSILVRSAILSNTSLASALLVYQDISVTSHFEAKSILAATSIEHQRPVKEVEAVYNAVTVPNNFAARSILASTVISSGAPLEQVEGIFKKVSVTDNFVAQSILVRAAVLSGQSLETVQAVYQCITEPNNFIARSLLAEAAVLSAAKPT